MTKIQKWGNSQGLRVTKDLLREAQLSVGDDVDVSVREGQIVIQPVTKVRGRYELKDLIAKIPKGHRAEETSWGPPVGREAW